MGKKEKTYSWERYEFNKFDFFIFAIVIIILISSVIFSDSFDKTIDTKTLKGKITILISFFIIFYLGVRIIFRTAIGLERYHKKSNSKRKK